MSRGSGLWRTLSNHPPPAKRPDWQAIRWADITTPATDDIAQLIHPLSSTTGRNFLAPRDHEVSFVVGVDTELAARCELSSFYAAPDPNDPRWTARIEFDLGGARPRRCDQSGIPPIR